jgi:hypothetical protein
LSLSFLLNTWSFTFNDFCSPLASTKMTKLTDEKIGQGSVS